MHFNIFTTVKCAEADHTVALLFELVMQLRCSVDFHVAQTASTIQPDSLCTKLIIHTYISGGPHDLDHKLKGLGPMKHVH